MYAIFNVMVQITNLLPVISYKMVQITNLLPLANDDRIQKVWLVPQVREGGGDTEKINHF